MKEVIILTVDSRGRIVLPKIIRKSLGITTNSQLMLVADSEEKFLKIIPIGLGQDSFKLRITLKDQAGALAKIMAVFGSLGISLVYEETVIIEKGRTAICTVIGPKPKDMKLEDLQRILKREGDAIDIEITSLE
jgi:AbrB family looped-hinge helix DNA binding protein